MKTYYRLPTGNTTGEFQSLYTQYPTYDQMRKYPVGMVLNGRYYWGDSTLNWQDTRGLYWSSSAYTRDIYAHFLDFYGAFSEVYPADNASKLYGFSLRCLGKKGMISLKSLSASQPVALLENTKLSTITIIAILL